MSSMSSPNGDVSRLGKSMKTTTLADEIHTSMSGHSFTVWDSLYNWGCTLARLTDSRYYEEKVLEHVNLGTNKRVEVVDTVVDEENGYRMHEVCITNGDGSGPDIVVVHGYAAALGFFYTNMNGLSDTPNCKLHVIDLLGFGCSDRPKFPISSSHHINDVLATESFFVDSFEVWRLKRGIETCSIVAHSLGGYLMSCYYLKYGKVKRVVKKLVLVSPVGVEDSDVSAYNQFDGSKSHNQEDTDNADKYNIDKNYTQEEEYQAAKKQGVDLSKEFTDHLHEDHGHGHPLSDEDPQNDNSDTLSIISTESDDTKIEQMMKQIKTRVQPGKFLTRLWEWNYTPLDIVRWFGPLAGKVVAIWVYNRFSRVEDDEQLFDICNYTTSIFTERGSGEYALNGILAPGSLGRLPLCKRLPLHIDIPVLMLYGELDWMDKKAGLKLTEDINQNGGTAKFRIVPNAGHHLYVDNREEFERQVLAFLE